MRGGSRLFTYAVEDEFEGVERGRGGGEVGAEDVRGRCLWLCLFSLGHIA